MHANSLPNNLNTNLFALHMQTVCQTVCQTIPSKHFRANTSEEANNSEQTIPSKQFRANTSEEANSSERTILSKQSEKANGCGGDDAGDGEGGGVVGDGGFEGGGVVESSGRVQGGGGLVASRRKAPVQCTEKDVILSRQAARRGEACASQLASSGVRAHGGARTHLP